jgi:multicomponent Na+:H+ antiporter subunit E
VIAAWSLVLGIVWVGMTATVTVSNLLAGYGVAAVVLLFLRRGARRSPLGRLWPMTRLALYFAWELVVANLRVAYDVATPHYRMRPGVVGIPLDATTDLEITLLANLITLTPGTLSLDVSEDRRTLYVHAMYVPDRDRFVRSIKDGFERRLLEAMR